MTELYGRYGRSRRRRSWDARNPGNGAILDELRDRVLASAGGCIAADGDVLDVGCGGGRWLRALDEAGVAQARLHGVELIPQRLSAVRAALPGATIRRADARRLPFPERTFSLVLMFTVLSSAASRSSAREMFAEGLRVLAAGGMLLVYEPVLVAGRPGSRTRVTPGLIRSWTNAPHRLDRVEPLTVLPPLARRLGRRTERLYPRLARTRPLLSHRLVQLGRDR